MLSNSLYPSHGACRSRIESSSFTGRSGQPFVDHSVMRHASLLGQTGGTRQEGHVHPVQLLTGRQVTGSRTLFSVIWVVRTHQVVVLYAVAVAYHGQWPLSRCDQTGRFRQFPLGRRRWGFAWLDTTAGDEVLVSVFGGIPDEEHPPSGQYDGASPARNVAGKPLPCIRHHYSYPPALARDFAGEGPVRHGVRPPLIIVSCVD